MTAPTERPLREIQVMAPLPEGALDLLKLRNQHPARQETGDEGQRAEGGGQRAGGGGQRAGGGRREAEAANPAAGSDAGPNAPEPVEIKLALRPALTDPRAVDKVGHGTLQVIHEEDGRTIYGRSFTVAEVLNADRILLVKWIRRLTNWSGRQVTRKAWDEKISKVVAERLALQKTPLVRFEQEGHKIHAVVSIADLPSRALVDSHGVALWKPFEREIFPPDCAVCSLVPICRNLPPSSGVASTWLRLGLIDPGGVPTLRGRLVSFFHQGDGLAIGAALEDVSYPLDELIYDLANLDAGFRFCGEENRWGGRIPMACHDRFGLQSIPGYLENGLPPSYGSGAEQIVAGVHQNPLTKSRWVTEFLGAGDIDRVIIEWRSLLRQIAKAPALDWPRWTALQAMAAGILNETESPTLTDLPPLDYVQTRRIDHQLSLRRH